MIVRLAKKEDSNILSRLIISASESVRESDFSDDGWALLENTNTVTAFEQRFSLQSYFALISEIEGEPAGYIAMLNFEKIDHMFVLPKYRGLGVCRQLWERARNICEKSGHGSYYWVRSSTAAEPVYTAFGFHSSGAREVANGISFQLMERGSKTR